MEIYIYDKPLIGSQAIPFCDYEEQRRKELIGSSERRTIFLWLAGDKLKSKDSPEYNDWEKGSIRVELNDNTFRLKELPELWQTPSHRISIGCHNHLRHGLEPIMEMVARLEDQNLDCMICNSGCSSSVVPEHISYASPNIVSDVKTKGFNLKEYHTWYITPEQFTEQLSTAQRLLTGIHEKFSITKRGEGRFNRFHYMSAVSL